MKSLTFVMPVHGRLDLAGICLRQLRRTCDALTANNLRASAVVVSDKETLRKLDPTALGFAAMERENDFLSARFNDGIMLATDPRYAVQPADYVVPFGSDDWADHRLFLEPLPAPNEVQGFQHVCFVKESGTEICPTFLNFEGGCGIRIIPRELVAPLDYRPCDEDRGRGCDTSILVNLRSHHGDRLKVKHFDAPAHWIVDWKTKGEQLNPYRNVTFWHRSEGDPFAVLADHYPAEALEEMQAYYGLHSKAEVAA